MPIHAPARRIAQATALLAAALALAACSGTNPAPAPTAASAIPHAITFTVDGHGTAALTWPGGATTHTTLPWHTTSTIPLGPDGVALTVQLDATGGQATCSVTVDGKRLVTSLAQGPNSRATCHTGTAQAND